MPPRLPNGMRQAAPLLLAMASVLVARSSLADHYRVPSGSMEPTVHVEDHILVDKLAYGVRVPLLDRFAVRTAGPSRGDVVVLSSPEDSKVLLKRVVALPGDRVAVIDGALELNGVRVPIARDAEGLSEALGGSTHAVNLDGGGGPDLEPILLPADAYLVLGDNRGNSKDGRYFGLVRGGAIIGRARVVVWRDGGPAWIAL